MAIDNMDYFWDSISGGKQNVKIAPFRMVNNCLSEEENIVSPDEVHSR